MFEQSLRAISIYFDHPISGNEDPLFVKLLKSAVPNDSPLAVRDAHNPLTRLHLSHHPLLPHYPAALRLVPLWIHDLPYARFKTYPLVEQKQAPPVGIIYELFPPNVRLTFG